MKHYLFEVRIDARTSGDLCTTSLYYSEDEGQTWINQNSIQTLHPAYYFLYWTSVNSPNTNYQYGSMSGGIYYFGRYWNDSRWENIKQINKFGDTVFAFSSEEEYKAALGLKYEPNILYKVEDNP